MRPLFRGLLRSLKKIATHSKRSFSNNPKMSSSGTVAALYAATISTSSVVGAVPEEAKDKKHHLKNGKGFINPWDSWRELSGPTIFKAIVWCVSRLFHSILC